MDGVRRNAPDAGQVAQEIAGHAGRLGIEICDVAGNVEEIAARIKRQSALFADLRKAAAETATGNERIARAAQHAHEVANRAEGEVSASRTTVEASL